MCNPGKYDNLTADMATRKQKVTFSPTLTRNCTTFLSSRPSKKFFDLAHFGITPRQVHRIDKKLNFQPPSWALINILHQTSQVEYYLCLFYSTFFKVSDNRTHKKENLRSSNFEKWSIRLWVSHNEHWTHIGGEFQDQNSHEPDLFYKETNSLISVHNRVFLHISHYIANREFPPSQMLLHLIHEFSNWLMLQ